MKHLLKVFLIVTSLSQEIKASSEIYDAGFQFKNQMISKEDFFNIVNSEKPIKDSQTIEFLKALAAQQDADFQEVVKKSITDSANTKDWSDRASFDALGASPSATEDAFLKDLQKTKEPVGAGSLDQSSQYWIVGASLLALIGYGLRDKQVSVRLFKF